MSSYNASLKDQLSLIHNKAEMNRLAADNLSISKIAALERTNSHLQSEIGILESHNSELSQNCFREMKVMERKLIDLRRRNEETVGEYARENQAKTAEIEALKSKLRDLVEQKRVLDSKLRARNEDQESAQAKLSTIESNAKRFQQHVEAARNREELLKRGIRDLKSKLVVKSEETIHGQHARRELDNLIKLIKNLESLFPTKRFSPGTQDALGEIKTSIEFLQEDRNEIQMTIKHLEEALPGLKKGLDPIDVIKRARAVVISLERERKNLTEEAARIRQELVTIRNLHMKCIGVVPNRIKDSTSRQKTLDSLIKELANEGTRLMKEKGELQSHQIELEQLLNGQESTISGYHDKINEISSHQDKTGEGLQFLKEEVQKSRKDIETLSREKAEMNLEIIRLSKQIDIRKKMLSGVLNRLIEISFEFQRVSSRLLPYSTMAKELNNLDSIARETPSASSRPTSSIEKCASKISFKHVVLAAIFTIRLMNVTRATKKSREKLENLTESILGDGIEGISDNSEYLLAEIGRETLPYGETYPRYRNNVIRRKLKDVEVTFKEMQDFREKLEEKDTEIANLHTLCNSLQQELAKKSEDLENCTPTSKYEKFVEMTNTMRIELGETQRRLKCCHVDVARITMEKERKEKELREERKARISLQRRVEEIAGESNRLSKRVKEKEILVVEQKRVIQANEDRIQKQSERISEIKSELEKTSKNAELLDCQRSGLREHVTKLKRELLLLSKKEKIIEMERKRENNHFLVRNAAEVLFESTPNDEEEKVHPLETIRERKNSVDIQAYAERLSNSIQNAFLEEKIFE